MKINLSEAELHEAVREYVSKELMDLSTKTVTVEIVAKRQPSRFEADVDVVDPDIMEVRPPFAADNNVGTEENQPALDLDIDD